MEEYIKFNNKICQGYFLNGSDTSLLLDKIKFYCDESVKPFYQTEPHRKVFYDKEYNIYIKIVEESHIDFFSSLLRPLFGLTSDKYWRYYNVLRRLKISTPKLLACLSIKHKNMQKSAIITKGDINTVQLSNFISSNSDNILKYLAIKELAALAKTLHSAGYYFSLDLRNILVKADGTKLYLSILDLEHMKTTFLAKRRVARNLRRFKRSLLSLQGTTANDWNTFTDEYSKKLE